MPIGKAPDSTSQSANLLKDMTNYEKGEHYLQLSLATLDELASLSEHERLSTSQKASYAEAYRNARTLSEETIRIRNRLSAQKKPFHKFFVNLFIRQSSTKNFYKVSYRNFSSIKRTSDDLNRQLVSKIDALLASGNLGESAQDNEAVNEESLRNVMEDNPAEGISPDENTRSINLDAQKARVAICEEDEENDSTRSPCDIVEGNHSGWSKISIPAHISHTADQPEVFLRTKTPRT